MYRILVDQPKSFPLQRLGKRANDCGGLVDFVYLEGLFLKSFLV